MCLRVQLFHINIITIVGSFNFFVDIAILNILSYAIGFNNKKWTFRDNKKIKI